MSANIDSGEAEYPFPKQVVFDCLLRAVSRIEGMSVHSSDALAGRVVIKTGMSLLSWGENIHATLTEPGQNRTLVRIGSAPKTGISRGGFLDGDGFFASGDLSFGKNRRNVERIFSELSSQLRKVAPAMEAEEKKAVADKKKCPFCAEMIQREAIKCRFCGSDIPVQPAVSNEKSDFPAPEMQPANAPKLVGTEVHFECHTCEQPIAVDAEAAGQEFRCPECGEHLVVPRVR
ncbi:MAG: hypothetical protein ABFD89_05255 [Bryobacteraceae bacterium]